jgi:murein DD-endopeptidase MepM/ murein hydrolase activator NlpD
MTGRSLLLTAGGVVVAVLLCGAAAGAMFNDGDPSNDYAFTCPIASSLSASGPSAPAAAATTVSAASTPAAPVTPAADGSYPRIGQWGPSQVTNAATIIAVGQRLNIPSRGWVVALATAMQESSLNNLDGGDRDSLGLFQQRPSQGWGTRAQISDPVYSATRFYQRLLTVDGWQNLPITDAAQAVQISALPQAYARWETDATTLVTALAGAGITAGNCAAVAVGAQGWVAPVNAPIVSEYRSAHRPGHDGVDLGAARGTTIVAAAAGTVSRVRCNVGKGSCDVDGHPGLGGCGWYVDISHSGGVISRYCHMLRRPLVAVGQQVSAGQPLGVVGSSGNSSGPHLHFEIHLRGDAGESGAVEPVEWMRQHGAPLGSNAR